MQGSGRSLGCRRCPRGSLALAEVLRSLELGRHPTAVVGRASEGLVSRLGRPQELRGQGDREAANGGGEQSRWPDRAGRGSPAPAPRDALREKAEGAGRGCGPVFISQLKDDEVTGALETLGTSVRLCWLVGEVVGAGFPGGKLPGETFP